METSSEEVQYLSGLIDAVALSYLTTPARLTGASTATLPRKSVWKLEVSRSCRHKASVSRRHGCSKSLAVECSRWVQPPPPPRRQPAGREDCSYVPFCEIYMRDDKCDSESEMNGLGPPAWRRPGATRRVAPGIVEFHQFRKFRCFTSRTLNP